MAHFIPKTVFEEMIARDLDVPQMADELWVSPHTVRNRLKAYGLVARSLRAKLKKGTVYNELEVRKYLRSDGQTTFYRCRCLRCRSYCTVRRSDLVGLKQLTCGCAHGASGKDNYRFSGHKEISGSYWGSVKSGAAKREFVFNLTIKDAWRLFISQERKCALSGVPISFSDRTASLDRIDSSLGYTSDNVQWVHKDVNRMKQHYDEDYFIRFCRLITAHNPS